MSIKVSQITLVVKNQTAALEFYTQKVGFEKKTDVTPPGRARWVTVGPKGQDLELALLQEDTPNEWHAKWKPAAFPPIVLRVADCKKTFDEMKARGVSFNAAEPDERPWGLSATFADPDGNLFSLSQPKGW